MDLPVFVGTCVALGLVALVVADLLKIPGILLYLGVGLLLGPAGLDLAPTAQLQKALPFVVPLLAGIILFEGGVSLDVKAIRSSVGPLRKMLTIGVLVNFVGATLAAWLVGGVEFGVALLFGSLMVVTGPTVVLPILRRTPLQPRVRALLHWEAILVDPIGVVLAVATMTYVLHRTSAGLHPLLELATQLVLGSLVGAAAGGLVAWLVRRPEVDAVAHPERANLAAFAAAFGAWAAGEALVAEGGVVAVTAAGLAFAVTGGPVLEPVRRFGEQVTSLAVAGLFVLLVAATDPFAAVALGWRGVAAVAAVALVVRPLAIALCTQGSDLGRNERVYLAWLGPRGIIAASVAAVSAIRMEAEGMDGQALEALVFATIAATVVVQGLSARPMARLLGVEGGSEGGILVVGARLGAPIASALAGLGVRAVVVDTNPALVAAARGAGVDAEQGSALDRAFVERVCEEREVSFLLAATSNPEVNVIAGALGREILGHDHAARIAVDGVGRVPPVSSADAIALVAPLDVDAIAEQLERGELAVVALPMQHSGRLDRPTVRTVLFRVRGASAVPVGLGTTYEPGDVLLVLDRGVPSAATLVTTVA
jgi:NhaP-type Na+/H+ or K+/H+ antiporter